MSTRVLFCGSVAEEGAGVMSHVNVTSRCGSLKIRQDWVDGYTSEIIFANLGGFLEDPFPCMIQASKDINPDLVAMEDEEGSRIVLPRPMWADMWKALKKAHQHGVLE